MIKSVTLYPCKKNQRFSCCSCYNQPFDSLTEVAQEVSRSVASEVPSGAFSVVCLSSFREARECRCEVSS
jgi:hypothetical protein